MVRFQLRLWAGFTILVGQSLAKFSWDLSDKAQFAQITPSATKPNVTKLEPQFFRDLNSQRVRVKYGPHSVPSSEEKGGMATFLDRNATKPCNDCLITWIQARLEYPNGTEANSDTGMWLHHSVALNVKRNDTVCSGTGLLPQRFFASGNERTPIDLCMSGTSKTGYRLKAEDPVWMLMELMNEMPMAREAVMMVDYEFIPGMPKDFEAVDTIWLDVGGCLNSDVTPKSNTTSEYTMSPAWKAPMDGTVLGLGSHLHDGGTHLTISKNGDEICDSVATYGATKGYIDPNMMPGMNMSGKPGASNDMPTSMMHISNITSCYMPQNGQFNAGDEFNIKAYYDMTKHMGMYEKDGKASDIMGISVMYILPKKMDMAGEMNGGTNNTTPMISGGWRNTVCSAVLISCLFVALII